jgi:hypothetical protein
MGPIYLDGIGGFNPLRQAGLGFAALCSYLRHCTGIKVAELLGLLTFYGEPRTVLINGRRRRVGGGT